MESILTCPTTMAHNDEGHVFPTVATVLAKVFAEAGVKGTEADSHTD